MLPKIATRRLETRHIAFTNEFPLIICLCGSTRFMDAFREANETLTMRGFIVLSVGVNTKAGQQITDAQKKKLDELHFEKIRLADVVLVLNVKGYIGESTLNEIKHARALLKPTFFLEPIETITA